MLKVASVTSCWTRVSSRCPRPEMKQHKCMQTSKNRTCNTDASGECPSCLLCRYVPCQNFQIWRTEDYSRCSCCSTRSAWPGLSPARLQEPSPAVMHQVIVLCQIPAAETSTSTCECSALHGTAAQVGLPIRQLSKIFSLEHARLIEKPMLLGICTGKLTAPKLAENKMAFGQGHNLILTLILAPALSMWPKSISSSIP